MNLKGTKVFGDSSFYKQIDNQQLDRGALRSAKRAVGGPGDGRVSEQDGKNIAARLTDGGKYTAVERDTAAFLREEMNFTPNGLQSFNSEIRSAGQQRRRAEEATALANASRPCFSAS